MSSLVGQNTITTFTSPVNGTSPIDANIVRSQDNTIKTAFNDHDSDGTLHLQDDLAASRPAAGTVGRKWLDNDTLRVYYDNGTVWQEIAYATLAGGTFTGPILLPNGLVGTPALAFANDPDCGLYRIGTNNIGFSINGAKILDISASSLTVATAVNATQLQISTAASRIIPGATSLSIRNNADSATNLSITNAGAVTIPGSLGVTGALFGTSITATASLSALATSGGTANIGTIGINGVTNGFLVKTDASDNINYQFATKAGLTAFSIAAAGDAAFGAPVTTVASATGSAGLKLPHGAAPTSPVNGDMWTTAAGLFVRINGVTVGPLS